MAFGGEREWSGVGRGDEWTCDAGRGTGTWVRICRLVFDFVFATSFPFLVLYPFPFC